MCQNSIHCECSKCLLAPTQPVSHFEKSLTALSIGFCGRLSQIIRSASAIVFWLCLSLRQKNNNLVIINQQNKLLFIKASLWRHGQ